MPDEKKDVVVKEEPAKENPKSTPKDEPKQAPAKDAPKEQDAPAEDAPPAAPAAEETKPEQANYKPIEAKDEKANPVYLELPKTGKEVAEEGTKLALADAEATGGAVPFLSDEPAKNKRIWSLDTDFNTNDRNKDGNHPDLVERGAI